MPLPSPPLSLTHATKIEHALAAVSKAATSLGIKAVDGAVLATEKRMPSTLVDSTSVQKICSITDGIGVVYAGMGPDYRVLVAKARKAAQKYYRVYKEEIPTSILASEIASIMQEFTQQGGVRPFGVSIMLAGNDDKGPLLYQIDPSGSFFAWRASAIGKNMANAKTFLEKRYNEEIELEDAIHTAILTLKEGFEGEMTEHTIEVGVVGEDRVFRVLTPAEVKDFLDEST